MKRFTRSIIAVFAIAATLVSCSKDEPSSEPVSKDPIVGNWMVDNAVVLAPDSAPETLDVDGDCPDKAYLKIKSDKTFEEQDVNPQTCSLITIKGTWEKTTENSMTIAVPGGGKGTFDIVSVTANKLVLRVNNFPNFPEGTALEFNYTKKQ